jgi:threonine aldolase
MHQSGILAAAGIVAMQEMVAQLAEDHANARYLAEGLAKLPGIEIVPEAVQTNIVIFGLNRPDLTSFELVDRLRDHGIRLFAMDGRYLRAVTHYGVELHHIQTALNAFACILV